MIAIPKEQRPYKRYGAAISAWRSRHREVVLSGPAGTGKSRALMEKLHYCADKYPGSRLLIARKTRESITQTAMITFEKKVLPEGWIGNLIRFRTSEQEYRYPNGSIIAVGGLDKASKIMSSEWDMIYVQEATELMEEDWGALTTRLRNGVMPYQQLIADCNPSYPTHWLKQRADRGECLMLESRHEDNPTVTPEYLAALDALPGVLKLRLRYGKWAAAEGMVYDEWDPAIHVLTKKNLVELGIFLSSGQLNFNVVKRVVASVDWGWTNPGAIQVYALDSDSRAYMVCELYRTNRDIDWWIGQAKELKQEYCIEQFVCDPAEPAFIEQFNKHQLNAIGSINSIPLGISEMHSRLKVAGDGRPRFFVYEYALRERDESRASAHRPFCFAQEIDAYAWPKSKDGQPVKEVPVKVDDHACLVAGTMVTTDQGDVPIEQIRPGDYVLTRYGYKRVNTAGVTAQSATVYTLHCSNGATLTGTGNHPIYIQGKGYTDLRAARYGDILEVTENHIKGNLLCQENQKPSFTRTSLLGAIPTQINGLIETTMSRMLATAKKASGDCIKKYGRMHMGPFQKAITSTTKMGTRSTTLLRTLDVYQKQITMPITSQPILRKNWQSAVSYSIEYDQQPLIGTNQRRGEIGIKFLDVALGRMLRLTQLYVKIAQQYFSIPTWDLSQDFAPISVKPQHVTGVEWTMSTAIVPIAEKSSLLTNIAPQSVAPIHVLKVCEEKAKQTVYNLTVDAPVGEYFANGILVHNCDAARYMALFLADPTMSAQDHLRAMERRAALAKQHAAAPMQGTIPVMGQRQTKKGYWE